MHTCPDYPQRAGRSRRTPTAIRQRRAKSRQSSGQSPVCRAALLLSQRAASESNIHSQVKAILVLAAPPGPDFPISLKASEGTAKQPNGALHPLCALNPPNPPDPTASSPRGLPPWGEPETNASAITPRWVTCTCGIVPEGITSTVCSGCYRLCLFRRAQGAIRYEEPPRSGVLPLLVGTGTRGHPPAL